MKRNEKLDMHIQNIVETGNIYEQYELIQKLKEYGFDVPQATISRRLKKLNIFKENGVYRLIKPSDSYLPRVTNIKISDFGIIMLHTYPGHAGSLAYYLDQKYVNFNREDLQGKLALGSIAGDDTVALIVKNSYAVDIIKEELKKDFPNAIEE